MKMQTAFISNVVLAIALLAYTGAASGQTPMDTAFTYQGKLTDDGPPEAAYDFDFGLYDQPNDGNQLALSCSVPNVPVEDQTGLFTVKVDFGSDVFNGEACWLQVAVKRTSDTDYTTLGLRQALTPTPYALYAESTKQECWELTGNAGTTAGTNFLGTTDDQPLELVGLVFRWADSLTRLIPRHGRMLLRRRDPAFDGLHLPGRGMEGSVAGRCLSPGTVWPGTARGVAAGTYARGASPARRVTHGCMETGVWPPAESEDQHCGRH